MIRLLIGFFKGAALGGGIGYGAYALGLGGGMMWVLAAVTGAIVGLFVGRPIWKHIMEKNSTSVTSILKMVVGAAIGCGLYALIRLWSGMDVELLGETRNVLNFQFIVGGAIGAVYGAFIEWDDGVGEAPKKSSKSAKK